MTKENPIDDLSSSAPPTQPSRGEGHNDIVEKKSETSESSSTKEAVVVGVNDSNNDEVNDNKKPSSSAPSENSSSLLEEKMRLTRGRVGVGVQLAPKENLKTKDIGVEDKTKNKVTDPSNKEKLRLAPGAERVMNNNGNEGDPSLSKESKFSLASGDSTVASNSYGAVRVGGNSERSDKNKENADIENDNNNNNNNNLIEAEVAPDMDEMVESEVQKRMKTLLEQQREEEQRQNIVVAEVASTDTNSSNGNKKLWVGIVIAILVAAAIGIGVWQSSSKSEDNVLIVEEPPPTTTTTTPGVPTPSPSTSSPSTAPTFTPPTQPPTALRPRVEAILAPYAPLDEQTMTWLTETSTWQPEDEGDPNYDYLWLERYAMALLYYSTNGPSWSFNANWLSDEPVCNWYSRSFIECPGLMGNIHMDDRGLQGTIPPVLFELSALTHLSLNDNRLTGSIPSTIGNLKSIEWMRLDDNQLTGTIPSSIGNLSNIENLELHNNNLNGSVPVLPTSLRWSSNCYFYGNCFSDLTNVQAVEGCDAYYNCGQYQWNL